MQLKERVKTHMFWVGLISLVLMFVDNVSSSYFGLSWSQELNKIEQTICIFLSILLFLGVLSGKKDKGSEKVLELHLPEKKLALSKAQDD